MVSQQSPKLLFQVRILASLQPVATIILAVLLLGERITVPFIIGGLLAVIGAQIASGKTSFTKVVSWLKTL